MSDIKQKASYEEMAFYYEMSVTNAVDNLFNQTDQHGWTREEFDKIYYTEMMQNALGGNEPVLH